MGRLVLLLGLAGCGAPGNPGAAPAREPLDRSLALLPAGEGPILLLPWELGAPGQGAPEGTNAAGDEAARRAGHALLLPVTHAPLHEAWADPLPVLAAIAHEGSPFLLLPPARPGEVVAGLGVTAVVVVRDRVGVEGMALLDPLLRAALGPPARDLVAGVDVYHLDPREGGVPGPTRLFAAGDRPPPHWLPLEDWLVRWGPGPTGS